MIAPANRSPDSMDTFTHIRETSTPVLAYLLMVHQSPRQLAKLVAALQAPDVQFFVHVDRKVEAGQFRYMVRRQRNVKFVRPRHLIEWGGCNMVRAELVMMRAAVRAGAKHLVLLSGADFPVWSTPRLTNYFTTTSTIHIEHYPIPSIYWDRGALNRVRQYWLCDDPFTFKRDRWFRTVGRVWRGVWNRLIRRPANFALKVGYELGLRRGVPGNLKPFVGSQWWSMPRSCAEYVLDFVEKNPDIVKFYRYSHVPDESFIQTLVMNSPLRDSVDKNNLRYVEWDGGFNPRILDLGDLDAIVASGAAFARKIVLSGSSKTGSSDTLLRALVERRRMEAAEFDTTRPRTPRLHDDDAEPSPLPETIIAPAFRERASVPRSSHAT
mgnify:CR=1 FL=1